MNGQALPIEDYAMIGDRLTAALVGKNGSIDWLCLPRFDSAACFAALVGKPENGFWQIAPKAVTPKGGARVTRNYRDSTMILETLFETDEGAALIIDFMVPGGATSHLVRLVRGVRGHVAMEMRMALRFDYGMSIPWVTRLPGEDQHGIVAIVGPDMVTLRTHAKLRGEDMTTVSDFTLRAGETVAFTLSHGASHLPPPDGVDPEQALRKTEEYWVEFAGRCRFTAPANDHAHWRPAVVRSLITLKALTYAPTGGIVAAPTTSLPEQLGGARNWDYRYCWLRDATLVLFALMGAGYTEEAIQWRDWLQRTIAGSAAQLQIMYGIQGERRLDEWEVPWLAGYQGAKPVRIGNAASGQIQLDVYGEVLQCLHISRHHGMKPPHHGWDLQRGIVEHLTTIWDQPDEGMWEVRGGARHFTFSKVMAWTALDRMVKDAKHFHLAGDSATWRALRDRIRTDIMAQGFDTELNSFVQSYGAKELDASLLMLPKVGFLPAKDPRMLGTVAAIEKQLMVDGFVQRYQTASGVDGLEGNEGAFLACTFWLADAYAMQGRRHEAIDLFERLLDLRNDVGLLSEEYDPRAKRQVGNFPQAFSHVALVGTAVTLTEKEPGQRFRTSAEK
jgi:GH15 family glucan-1,4-alpha-glucosidase